MLKFLLAFGFVVLSGNLFAQEPEKVPVRLGENPLIFLDSVSIDRTAMLKFDPLAVASLTLLEGKDAMLTLGEAAKDGVIYIESIPFAKKRFQRYFRTKSKEYEDLVPNFDSDSTFQYILNDKVLEKDFEGNLASIDDKVFKQIKILSKEDLEKEYNINNKLVGVLIRSEVPKDLYNGKKKF